jgi:hypothetical protein
MSGFENTLERGFCDSVGHENVGNSAIDTKVRAFDDSPAAYSFILQDTSGFNSTIQESARAVSVGAASR